MLSRRKRRNLMNKKDKIIENIFHKRNFKKRAIAVVTSVIMMGLSLSILFYVDMGIDPCSVMNLGVANLLGMSLGNWQLLFNLLLFFIVLRYAPSQIGLGTLANMILVGYSMDFFRWVWNKTLPMEMFDILYIRIAILIPALFTFILAVSIYIAVDLGTSPYDAIPAIISSKQNIVPYRVIRIVWDTAAAVIGFMLGSTIGIVTIIMAFALGPAITIVQKRLVRYI